MKSAQIYLKHLVTKSMKLNGAPEKEGLQVTVYLLEKYVSGKSLCVVASISVHLLLKKSLINTII